MGMDGARTSYVVLMAIYAALVYDIISATNSSPQTTEINAGARAPTLMKWVNIGLAQAAGFILLGAIVSKSTAPLVGGGAAAGLLYFQYVHAKNAGLANPGKATESYA